MRNRRVLVTLVVFATVGLALASGPEKSSMRPNRSIAGSDQPFSTFHRVDALLTKLDHDSQELRSQLDQAAKLRRQHQREIALRKLRTSAKLREAIQTSSQLMTISQRAEALYAKRRQEYGRVLFREMNTRAAAMHGALVRETAEPTVSDFAHQEYQFRERLLTFILQFQAISGGYAALACDPGGWTCCQPRMVKTDGGTEMRGCTWRCASKTRACHGGCLGPKIPNVVAAIQPSKPKLPSPAVRQEGRSRSAE